MLLVCARQDRDAVQAPSAAGRPDAAAAGGSTPAAGPPGAPAFAQQPALASQGGAKSPNAASSGAGVGGGSGGGFLDDLLQSSYARQAPGTGDMRHGTEGWAGLETSFWVRRAPTSPAMLHRAAVCATLVPGPLHKAYTGIHHRACAFIFPAHGSGQLPYLCMLTWASRLARFAGLP